MNEYNTESQIKCSTISNIEIVLKPKKWMNIEHSLETLINSPYQRLVRMRGLSSILRAGHCSIRPCCSMETISVQSIQIFHICISIWIKKNLRILLLLAFWIIFCFYGEGNIFHKLMLLFFTPWQNIKNVSHLWFAVIIKDIAVCKSIVRMEKWICCNL